MSISSESRPWSHTLVSLPPNELAPLQRRYVGSLLVPTLTDLDLRLREGIRTVGVKVGTEVVAFAIVQPDPPDGLPAPLLVSIAAPGQNSSELRAFFQEVIRTQQIRAVWGRSDDALLLELLMLEGWRLRPMGPLLITNDITSAPELAGVELRHLAPADFAIVFEFFKNIPLEEGGQLDEVELRKQLQDRVLDGLLEDGVLRAVSRLLPQPHPEYVSLTVVVDPAHRARGFGRVLAADVAAEEVAAGRQVIGAFGPESVASRRLVESVGAYVAATYYLATPG